MSKIINWGDHYMAYFKSLTVVAILGVSTAQAVTIRYPIAFERNSDNSKAALFGQATGLQANLLKVFRPSDDTLLFEKEIPDAGTYGAHLQFSNNGSTLLSVVSAYRGSRAEVINAGTGASQCIISEPGLALAGKILSSDSQFALVTKTEVKILALSDCAAISTFQIQLPETVRSLLILSSSQDTEVQFLAVSIGKVQLATLSTASGELILKDLSEVPNDFYPTHAKIRPGTNEIWMMSTHIPDPTQSGHDFMIIVANSTTVTATHSMTFGGSAFHTDYSLAFSDDGSRAVATTGWGLYSFDGATKQINASYDEIGCELLHPGHCSDDDSTVAVFAPRTSNRVTFAGDQILSNVNF